MNYMIELHHVPHELRMYIEDLKGFGDITYYSDSLPTFIFMESLWEKDIIESLYGVKKVWTKRFNNTPISVVTGRKWTELLGTKWEVNPE